MFLLIGAGCLVVIVAVLGGMLAFGTRPPPPTMTSINKPFESVDFSDMPEAERIPSRDGSPIAFRHWPPSRGVSAANIVVIAIHGSSAWGGSLHPLAKALSAHGIAVYAPDLRGHGATGRRGDIDYAGQLDDDLADLTAAVKSKHPNAELVLLGFSSGGGFALHIAATPLGKSFARTVLLSPMLGIDAPTITPSGRDWASVYLPRIIAISILDRVGIHAFDHLPVLAFGIDPRHADVLTGRYSMLLMKAFGTADYVADLRAASSPMTVLVGGQDELFKADAFAPTIAAVRTDVPVVVVPGLGHIQMTTDPRAVPAIAAAVRGAP